MTTTRTDHVLSPERKVMILVAIRGKIEALLKDSMDLCYRLGMHDWSRREQNANHALSEQERRQILAKLEESIGTLLEDPVTLAYKVGVSDGMKFAREVDQE